MSIGHSFIAAVVAEGSVAGLLDHGSIETLFRDNELPVYEFVKQFVFKHGQLPTLETIKTHTGSAFKTAPEPASYYLDLMQQRYVERQVKSAMTQASDLLTVTNKDPEKALQILTDMAMAMALQKQKSKIVDFRDAYDLVIPAYVSKYHETDGGLLYGWPTLDKMTGGVRRGDLVSFVGRPAQGKTFQMLYAAHYGWRAAALAQAQAAESAAGSDVQEETVPVASRMFVSMEMEVGPISERLAAMQASVPLSQLKHAELSTHGLKKLKHGLTEVKGYGAPFWVVDGNLAATVEDIWLLVRQLQPDALFLDGGYLVKHPTERDRFKRVAENAELMKSELSKLCPVTVSWQFAKSASKKKKGEQVTGDDVGYSDAIFQVSSLLMGLFQPESVETLLQRVVDILKGRNGETGRFATNWDFQNMDFSEVQQVDVGDLQFI